MSNDLHNLEAQQDVPEFTKEEKDGLISKLEAVSSENVARILMPKMSDRFRVRLSNFGTGQNEVALMKQIRSATIPEYCENNFAKFGLGSSGEYSDFSIVIFNDITSISQQEVIAQLDAQKKDTKLTFDCIIEILDGTMNHTHLETRKITGCRITNIYYSALDYSVSDVQEIILSVSAKDIEFRF